MQNLGPTTEKMLAEIGITHQDELRAMGAVAAWHRLKFVFGKRVTLNALYGMHAGLENRHWQSVSPEEKKELQRQLKTKPEQSQQRD